MIYVPGYSPCTRTENEHVVVAPAGREPSGKLMMLDPAVAVTVPVIVPELHVKPDTLGGLAITSPSGNVSTKATPVRALALVLPIVNVSVV